MVDTGFGYIAPVRVFDRNDAPIDADNRFPVDAKLSSGEIEIGKVVIKDDNSSNTALVTSGGALLVTTSGTSGLPANVFNQTSVAGTTEVTLVSYTVPPTKTFYLSGVIVGGMADGRFTVRGNGITYTIARNSAANKTNTIAFPNNSEPTTGAGFVVDILCFNESNQSRTFEGTIMGFLR